MAIWLGIDELDFHGASVVANGWLQRAGRLLEDLEPAPEHGWLAFQEGYLAHLSSDHQTAARRARKAAGVGRRLKVADLEMLGLALEGSALVATTRVAEGMRRLDEATATALEGEASVPISCAWTFCFLVSSCLEVRDYGRAFDWIDRIAEFAGRHGSRYMLGFCRSHYGAVHLSRGRWVEAETEIVQAVAAYERSRPSMADEPLTWLAELRRRQGRHTDADALLARAGDGLSAQLCRARLAEDRGQVQRSSELAERCLRQVRDDSLEVAPALEVLVRARLKLGDVDGAAAARDALRAIADHADTLPLRGSALVADGRIGAARGDHGSAQQALEDAVDAFSRSGTPFEAATARLDLAGTLAAMGRTESAVTELHTAGRTLRALGAAHEADRADGMLAELRSARRAGAIGMGAITPREREVLGWLAQGWTNRQIAARLMVSEHTVHRHVTNVLRKLDVPSRSAAAAIAARSGLLPNQAP